MCGVGVRRGFAWCVRSQVVGMATRRGARDETGARPAQAMRLTANTKRNRDCGRARIDHTFPIQ